MNKKKLSFDKRKHVCYSNKVEEIILKHLRMNYSVDEANRLYEKIQLQYVEFLKVLPYLGGGRNVRIMGRVEHTIALQYLHIMKCRRKSLR